MVITESTARKYFGNANVVGNTIETDDNGGTIYKITAVINDIPSDSHIKFDFLLSMQNLDYEYGNYISMNFYTYLLLKDGTDYKQFEKKLDEYTINYAWPYARSIIKVESWIVLEKPVINSNIHLLRFRIFIFIQINCSRLEARAAFNMFTFFRQLHFLFFYRMHQLYEFINCPVCQQGA